MIKIPTRVLLVDDEKDFVEMLGLRLAEVGENVTPAHSGQECLQVLEKKEIDVVILDILMPGMDGIATLKEIKNRFPLVEVIMLTGHGSAEAAEKGLSLGAFDYLAKPCALEKLLEKIMEAYAYHQRNEPK